MRGALATAITTIATFTLAAAAVADSVSDEQGDNPASTIDINTSSVDATCTPTFAVTVLPQNALRDVEPTSGALPGVQIDRDGNGRTDRLVGQPKGKRPGVYAISRSKIGKRLASARRTVDPGQGYYVTWQVRYKAVVKSKTIRWRGVSRSAVSGALDRAPDKGFRRTSFRAICR